MSKLYVVEPKLVMRALKFTVPRGCRLAVQEHGLAYTESAIEYCEFDFFGPRGVVSIQPYARFIEED